MINRRWKHLLTAACAAAFALGAAAKEATASTATISTTASQTVKGWGSTPSYFRTDWDTVNHHFDIFTRPAIADAIYALGITFIRADVQPRMYVSGNTVANMVLDTNSINDLVNQIQVARNHGCTQYIMSCWTPPAVWKDNGSTVGGHLTAAGEPGYVAFYTKVIQTLNSRGVGLPLAISVQNEPDLATGYDSCIYMDTQAGKDLWKTLVKDMRTSLNANGMTSVLINGPECSVTDHDIQTFGNDLFPDLSSDPALNAALGAYAVHAYGECWWTPMPGGIAAHPKDAFITEWSIINNNVDYGTTEISWAVGSLRHFASNMVDLPMNYWCHWLEYQWGTSLWNNPLLTGDFSPIYSKRYWIYQKLWTNVRPGWIVHKMTCDNSGYITSNNANLPSPCDTMVDLVAFQNAGGTQSAVLLVNNTAGTTSMAVNGLKGATFTAYQTTASADMANVASGSVTGGSATVSLPAASVTVLLTASTGPPPAPAGLTATAGNAQVALSWNASAGATAYDVKRSTVSGSGYATVSSPTVTNYTNTSLTNGTTYYFVVAAKNASGSSANSSQVSATPTSGTGSTKYEAESAAISGGATVNNNHLGYSGTGFVDSYWNVGATTTFTVNASAAGNTTVTLHYGNATGSTKTVSIYVNGTKIKQTNLPTLANWDTWADVAETLNLNSGSNTIAYKYDSTDSGNINLDYILVAGSGGGSGNTHVGTWACKAVLTAAASYTRIAEVVNVTPNSTYVASFWLKGTGKLQLSVMNGSWGTVITPDTNWTATGTWTKVTTPAFNTGSNTQITYTIQDFIGGTAGTVYIDDTFLGINNGTNVLVNPGFESGNANWGPNGAFSIVQNP